MKLETCVCGMSRLLKNTPSPFAVNPAGFARIPSPQAWNKVENSFLTGISSQSRSSAGSRENSSVKRKSPSCSREPRTKYPFALTSYSARVSEILRDDILPEPVSVRTLPPLEAWSATGAARICRPSAMISAGRPFAESSYVLPTQESEAPSAFTGVKPGSSRSSLPSEVPVQS